MIRIMALAFLVFSQGFALQDTLSIAKETPAPQERPSLMLYYSNYCPYSQKVLHYLKKIHKTVPMKNVMDDPQYKKELSEIGDQLLVPCLVIDGKAVYDADAIIDWLSKHQDQLDSN